MKIEPNLPALEKLDESIFAMTYVNNMIPFSILKMSTQNQVMLQTSSTSTSTLPLSQGSMLIHSGPRMRNQATWEMQDLLEKLILIAPNNVKVTLDASGDWLISMPNQEPTNLSLLMRHANLSHLVLSDTLINALAKLTPILDNAQYILDNLPAENVFSYLPKPLVAAIRFYTSMGYVRFNEFWRGEPDVDLKDHAKSIGDDALQLFLIGVFCNIAIARIPHLLSIHEDCQDMMLPTEFTLQRKEQLNQNEQVRLRRGLQGFGPLLSMSYKDRPTLEITNPSRYTVSVESISIFNDKDEAEILLTDNVTVEWGAIVNGKRTGQMVNTPDIDVAWRFPVAKALSIAFRNHYSKRYGEASSANDSQTVNGVLIHRPVHALAHITECLLFLPASIALFAEHALSAEMRLYCQTMSNEEFEFLSTLVVYKNTGRESEVSFRDPKYNLYKNASAENFVKYAKQYTSLTDAQIAQGRELIRERGNPNYTSDDPIMLARIQILNINHDLDLWRLFSDGVTESALILHLPLFVDNAKMRADFKLVKEFAVACITAMGEMGTTYTRNYRAPFHIFSTRVGIADELLQHCPRGIPSSEETKLFVQVIQSFTNSTSAKTALNQLQISAEDLYLLNPNGSIKPTASSSSSTDNNAEDPLSLILNKTTDSFFSQPYIPSFLGTSTIMEKYVEGLQQSYVGYKIK